MSLYSCHLPNAYYTFHQSLVEMSKIRYLLRHTSHRTKTIVLKVQVVVSVGGDGDSCFHVSVQL